MNSFFPTNDLTTERTAHGLTSYKIPLRSMNRDLLRTAFHTGNVYQLTKIFNPTLSPDFHEEIYGIIPIQQHLFRRTLVLYKDYMMYVDMTSFQIIKRILKSSPLLNFNAYTKTLQNLFNSNTTIIPIATPDYSLIPLGPVKSNETIWVNPGRVSELSSNNLETLLLLTNEFTICSDRLIKGISKRMMKGFLAHGILKRESDCQPVWPSMNLLEYLELPSTSAVRYILRHVQFQHLPYLQGDFFRIYGEVYEELVKNNLLNDLDIEE